VPFVTIFDVAGNNANCLPKEQREKIVQPVPISNIKVGNEIKGKSFEYLNIMMLQIIIPNQ
jgi:hypothetical protein